MHMQGITGLWDLLPSNGCMNGWKDGWMDGWMDGCMNGQTDHGMDEWEKGWIVEKWQMNSYEWIKKNG